jgi:hypothetical protein
MNKVKFIRFLLIASVKYICFGFLNSSFLEIEYKLDKIKTNQVPFKNNVSIMHH